MLVKTASEFTNSPALFAKTAWGKLNVNPRPEVLRPRNEMATELDLKNALVLPEAIANSNSDIFLHAELYSTNTGGRVLLVSPLRGETSSAKGLSTYGFKPYKPLWYTGLRSHMITFASPAELKTFLSKITA